MRIALVVGWLVMALACGGGSGPQPQPPGPTPQPQPPGSPPIIPPTVPPGSDLPLWNLTWTVTDAATGRPLAGVAIHAERIDPLRGPVRDRTTDGNGFAHIDARQGRWRATLSKAGYLDLTWEFDVLRDEHKPPQLQPRPPPTPPPPVPPQVHGPVRADRHVLRDNDGPFLGLGATCMWCVWGYEHDRQRLEANLRYLAAHDIGYVRILAMVGAQPYWQGRVIQPDPQTIDDFAAFAFALGLRTQVTLFADAQVVMPSSSARERFVDDVAGIMNRHPERFVIAELANEAWQNGFGGSSGLAELRDLTRRLDARTAVLVAASAPDGQECETWQDVYAGLGAQVGTYHLDRDATKIDGKWRHVRQPWEIQFCDGLPEVSSSNEPIGPESSVAADDDPARLVSAAVTSYISGLGAYVYHPNEGIRGDRDYWETRNGERILDGLQAMLAYLPADLPNWTSHNHHWATHPFSPSLDDQIWPDGAGHGVVRAYAATQGSRFVVNLIGIRGYVDVVPRQSMTFTVRRADDGTVIATVTLGAGQSYRIVEPPGQAVVLIGQTQ